MTRDEIQLLIDAIADGVPNTALKVRNVLNAIADGTGVTGDVKEIDVPTAYITANFDVTGLGTNERLGWAICNGNNGTRNREKRVAVQFDPDDALYSTLGATGGSADAVVVAHTHTVTNVMGQSPATLGASSGGNVYASITKNTESSGVSGTNKNLQPYIVTLFIMKL